MNFEQFMRFAIAQDRCNKFSKLDNIPSIVPESLKEFYQNYNPVDVEVICDGVAVRFYPAEELERLQSEYSIPSVFVFATCNGDPIFLHEGVLYSYPHGINNPEWEKISNTLLDVFTNTESTDDNATKSIPSSILT